MEDYINELIENEDWETLQSILDQIEEHNTYARIYDFHPYKFQIDFYKAGATHKSRFLMAANRIN